MNVKKTLQTVVVWYDANTGKVSIAKCRKTGKFVSLAVAQDLLNADLLNAESQTGLVVFWNSSMKDFLLCMLLLACLIVLVGLPIGLIAVKIAGCDSLVVENIGIVKAAFVAWFLSIIIVASAGNK